MTTPELDPFFYQGSEAHKADINAQAADSAGRWEAYVREDYLHNPGTYEKPVSPPVRDIDMSDKPTT